MIQTLAVVLVLGFAAYRGARLVTTDTITDPLREAIGLQGHTRSGPRPHRAAWRWLHSLITCPYCVGLWLALGLTAVYRGWPWSHWRGGRWLVVALAVGGVQALVQSRSED